MTTAPPCEQYENAVIELATADSTVVPDAKLEQHLRTCQACRTFVESVKEREALLLRLVVQPEEIDAQQVARVGQAVKAHLTAQLEEAERLLVQPSSGERWTGRQTRRWPQRALAAVVVVLLVVMIGMVARRPADEQPIAPLGAVKVAGYVPTVEQGGRTPASVGLGGSESTTAVFPLTDSVRETLDPEDQATIDDLQKQTRTAAGLWKAAIDRNDWFAATVAAERLRRLVAVEGLAVQFVVRAQKAPKAGCLSSLVSAAADGASPEPAAPNAREALELARAGRLRNAVGVWNESFGNVTVDTAAGLGMSAEQSDKLRRQLTLLCEQ